MLKLGILVVSLMALGLFVSGCAPAGDAGGETQGSSLWLVVFLVAIFAMFYFMTIRPQRRRQKRHRELVSGLSRGDKVMTAGGIYGVIESLDEESVVLKVESGASLRVARTSVIGEVEK